MKRIFLLLFIFLPVFALGNDWVPLKNHIPNNKVLQGLTSQQGQVTYCIDGTQTKVLPNINKVFQIWFDNVLSYKDVYYDFDNTFQDILPILKRKNKLVVQQCATPFEFSSSNSFFEIIFKNSSDKLDSSNFLSHMGHYSFSTTKPILRIAFCKHDECFTEPRTGAACQTANIPEKRILVSTDWKKNPATLLLHEFGHALSLGDVRYGQEHNDRTYGYYTTDTFMANGKYLTCDDADAVVALLYLSLGKEKTFHSFCGYRIFDSGSIAYWKSIIDPITQEGQKYKNLRDLNRRFYAPIKEQEKAYNEKKLAHTLQESTKNYKKP